METEHTTTAEVLKPHPSVTIVRNTFAEHGNEIEEIISKKMPWFVRWGTVVFFFFLLLIAGVCWFIKYPELVSTNAKLSGINLPREVISKTEGRITSIFIKENETVKKEQILAYMESTAHLDAVLKLNNTLDTMSKLIAEQRTDELVNLYPDYTGNQQVLSSLGELQASYQTFMQTFTSFKDYLFSGFYLRKKAMLRTDIKNIQQQQLILQEQKKLLEEDLALSVKNFDANETLAKEKVISPLDYRTEKSKLISKQLSIPQMNAAIVSNESQQHEKTKEIAELENQIVVQKNSFIQALQTLKSQLLAWQQKYVLKAPVDGHVSFAGFIQENEEIKAGQLLFYVHPENSSYFLEMPIPQYNFGRVKKGQTVLLRFQAYPYEQFGTVTGIIDFISNSPTDSGFLARVSLPKGLQTNYNKSLQYQNGLIAQAEIVTEDMRLLERLYYNLVKQFKR